MNAVIVIPTYNEKGNIERLIEILEEEIFPTIQNHNMYILVADDNSPDGTAEVVKEYIKKYKNIEITTGEKKGLGAAYVRGMNYAIEKMNAQILFEMDADLFHDPNKISDFLQEKEKLGAFTGYTFQVGFLWNAVKDGFKIAEVPFNAKDRTHGKSKIPGMQTIIKTLAFVFKVRFQEIATGSFGKFLVVGGIGFTLQFIIYWYLAHNTNLLLGVASWIAAQLAIFSNYNLNNLWTFKERKAHSFSEYVIKMVGFFLSSNIGVIVIQSGIVQLSEYLFGRKYPFVYFIVATGVLLIYNFTMYSKVIWKRKPH